MFKTYSPKQFFREIPTNMFLEYFDKQKHPFPSEPKNPTPDQLYEFWDGDSLDKEARLSMDADFRAVHEFLFLPNAIESIYQDADFKKEHPDKFPEFTKQAETFFSTLESLVTLEEKAFWVITYHLDIFDNAFRFSSADRQITRRYYTRRPTGHHDKPKDDEVAENQLGESLAEYYRPKKKGPGHKVDILDRDGVIYYFVYLEDQPRSGVVFDKGKLKRQILRTSFEIVFWFNPENGELSTCVPGGNEVREELERRFAEICLGNPDLPALSKKPVYNLEIFKDKNLLLHVDRSEGFLSVRIKSLKLLSPETDHHIVIDSKAKTGDARELLERLIITTANGGTIPISEFKFANVEFEMIQTAQGRRSEKLNFNLFYPNGCNLGNSPRDRIIRTLLVQWGAESGGTDEILRQLLLSIEQNQVIGHFHTREWPENILAGLLEQRFLLPASTATAMHCLTCEEQPLCDVRYRDEGGISTPYITCAQCGPTLLKEEEIRQYKVAPDEIAAFIVKELGLPKLTIHHLDGAWELGAYPQGEPGDKVFLLLRTTGEESTKVKAVLENEAGLCFGLGLDFERPEWLPKRLRFFSLRREIQLDGKFFHLDAERVENVYDRFLDDLKPELKDEFENPRPVRLTLVGNLAEKDKELKADWRKYLGIYKPEVQVYLFEKETEKLDWIQAQRARFIYSGKSAESQYNRNLMKVKLGALSGKPKLEGGWYKNPYKQKRKKADSIE